MWSSGASAKFVTGTGRDDDGDGGPEDVSDRILALFGAMFLV
jgi:hypothetical protein